MENHRFSILRHLLMLAFLFITLLSFSQGTSQQYFGNGKGIFVEKTSNGYLVLVERATGYEAIHTDEAGNQTFVVDLGPLCDRIKRLPFGFGKLTKGNITTGSYFEYLDHSGTTIWGKGLGPAIGITHDFAQKSDGSFLFFASRSLGVPYGDNYFLNYDVNGNTTGVYFLVTAEFNIANDTVFIPYDGFLVEKTDGSFIAALSGVQKIGHGIPYTGTEYPATRVVHLDEIGHLVFSQTTTHVANLPFEVVEYLDLVATADNNYVTVRHWADLFTGHPWERFIHEKPGSWTFENNYGLMSIFSSGSADYFSIVPTADGGAVTAEHVVRDEYNPGTGTITEVDILYKTNAAGTTIWEADFPNHAYDMIELADGRLALTGEESGDAYLIILNADGSLDCPTPVGFSHLGSLNNHDYYLSNSIYNWPTAQSVAAANGGHIVTINDAAENAFIQSNIYEIVHIGLNDELLEGVLQWDSGEPVGYTNINTTCFPCGLNDSYRDYGAMMSWDGTWGFDNQWVAKRFILEKECNLPIEVSITYGCPTAFPQDIWSIPVTVTNNTALAQPAQTLYLHQDYQGGFPTAHTPNLHGQVAIPSLAPGASFSTTLVTTSIGLMPELIFVDGTSHYREVYGKYYLSFDPTGMAQTTEFDYYCKKFSSDLAIAITNPTPTYGSPDDIIYSVEITNHGTEDAHNIRAVLLEEYFSIGPSIFPFFVEVNVNGAATVAAIREDGATDTKIECHIESLPVGQSVTCDVIYHIGFGSPVPDVYTVDVSLSSGHLASDANMSNNSDSFTFTSDTGCPGSISGFTYLDSYNGHAYYMSNSIHTWHDAQSIAYANGGYLATMNDLAENSFLQSLLGYEMVYIGFQDETSEGSPVWENGEPVSIDLSYNNTYANDYAVMNFWAGTWEFYNIWVNKKFVMEMDCALPIAKPNQKLRSTSVVQIQDLYPNPATDMISVRIAANEDGQQDLQIHDALGRVLLQKNLEIPNGSSMHTFDIQEFSVGVYYLRILQSNVYQRFVKN